MKMMNGEVVMDANMCCIIPAKGTSTRLPNKNLMLLDGKPLIEYAVEAALNSGLFKIVAVSTDSVEVMEAVSPLKVGRIERPSWLSSNVVGVNEVVLHALWWMAEKGIGVFERVCVIYPTACMLRAEDLRGMHKILVEEGLTPDGIMAVVQPLDPPHALLDTRLTHNGGLRAEHPTSPLQGQRYANKLADAGQAYMYKAVYFKRYGFYPPYLRLYELPRERVVDLDYPWQVPVLQALWEHNKKQEKELGK